MTNITPLEAARTQLAVAETLTDLYAEMVERAQEQHAGAISLRDKWKRTVFEFEEEQREAERQAHVVPDNEAHIIPRRETERVFIGEIDVTDMSEEDRELVRAEEERKARNDFVDGHQQGDNEEATVAKQRGEEGRRWLPGNVTPKQVPGA